MGSGSTDGWDFPTLPEAADEIGSGEKGTSGCCRAARRRDNTGRSRRPSANRVVQAAKLTQDIVRSVMAGAGAEPRNLHMRWAEVITVFTESSRQMTLHGSQLKSLENLLIAVPAQGMIRSFRHRGLRRLYVRDDPSRISAEQVDRITPA